MRSSMAILLAGMAAVGALATTGPARSQPATTAPACAPAGGLSFICGLTNIEDIVADPSGRWVIGTAYKAGGAGLYVVDARRRTAQAAELSVAPGAGAAPYAGCAAPDFKALLTHGIELRPGKDRVHTLYVVNHGGRESIEVFDLDVRGPAPAIRWIGCILPPEGVEANGVAALPGGALAVTKFRTPKDPTAFGRILKGEITGAVYIWTPGKGFAELPGTRWAGDNGIVASPDGKRLFVADYGAKAIHRIALDGSAPPARVATAARPDNIRWAPDGKILVTGHFVDVPNQPGLHGWTVDSLDPETMALTPVLRRPGLAEFDNATTAVVAEGQLWLGTFGGDRIAYLPAP